VFGDLMLMVSVEFAEGGSWHGHSAHHHVEGAASTSAADMPNETGKSANQQDLKAQLYSLNVKEAFTPYISWDTRSCLPSTTGAILSKTCDTHAIVIL
jgi:hypothetical protein